MSLFRFGLDYAIGFGLGDTMIVSVAMGIHKIKHGGKPIPTFHPPFQWFPYITSIYNKQEV